MPTSRIRIDFEKMNSISRAFEQQGSAVRATIRSLKEKLGVLQAGDWVGGGANKFYQEMETTVLPSLQRLAAALEASAQTAAKIEKIMHQAEEDAAAIMRRRETVGAVSEGAAGAVAEDEVAALFRLDGFGPDSLTTAPQMQTLASGAMMAFVPMASPGGGGAPTKGQLGKARPATKKDKHKGLSISKMTDTDRRRMWDRLIKERARLELEMDMTPPTGNFAMRVRQRYERASKKAEPISKIDRTTVSNARRYDARRAELFKAQEKWFAKEIEVAKMELASANARFRSAQKALGSEITEEEMFRVQVMKLRANILRRAVERIEPAQEKYLLDLGEILPKETPKEIDEGDW